ncbi:alpha/beta fold hydrolase [Geodermatophilus sp. SYSU D00742]
MAATDDGPGSAGVARVVVDGARLAYRELGSGEPVVLVHGGISDLRTWAAQLEPLAARHRVIAYSRRFARPGADVPPGAADPMPVHVDDLVALLRELGATPAHLVGNSWGAFICLLTAIEHPDAVRSLVLEEPPLLPLVLGPGTRPHAGVLARSLLRHPGATLGVLAFGVRTFAPMAWAARRGDPERAWQLFARGVLGAAAFRALTEERRQQMRENATTLQPALRAGFPPLSGTDLRAVRVPTLLITGARSPRVVRALSRWLASLLPEVEQLQVPGASHLVHEDQPGLVNAAILAFLDRCRPRG